MRWHRLCAWHRCAFVSSGVVRQPLSLGLEGERAGTVHSSRVTARSVTAVLAIPVSQYWTIFAFCCSPYSTIFTLICSP